MPEFDPRTIRLIAGLGNNEKHYLNTYHNVGHLFVDGLSASQKTYKNEGFMNHAGASISKMTQKLGVKPHELLLVHDESDLELGTYKFSFGSGSAGHRGVKSVAQSLGTNDFWRLRIGIRPKRDTFLKRLMPRQKAMDFVLRPIKKRHREILNDVFSEIHSRL